MESILGIMSTIATAAGLIAASPVGITELPRADISAARMIAKPAYIASVSGRQGEPIGALVREGPLSTPIEALPTSFLEAVIAIEDHRFLEHRGLDPRGLAAAALSQFGPSPRGGSTIDQQMAKNVWLGPEVSLRRKIPEALLALHARQMMGPRGVLQLYLETAWFGRGVTGAAGAAQAWFGRPWEELTLGEIAYLAGLLKGPGFFDAERHPERARQRRDQVLNAMLREGYITEEMADAARAEEIAAAERIQRASGKQSRWIMSAARPAIARMVDTLAPGQALLPEIDITLSISQDWQDIAQDALTDAVSSLSSEGPFAQTGEALLRNIANHHGDTAALRAIAEQSLQNVLPWDSTAQAGLVLEISGDTWRILMENGEIALSQVSTPGRLRPAPGDVYAFRNGSGGVSVEGKRPVDGAVVILDPRTGEILASIGGAFPDITAFDRTRAARQPGSAIKTFLWLAAFENGYTPEMWIEDTERDFITEDGIVWRPRNYGRGQAGTITLRTAFEQSSNLSAAHLIYRIGADAMADIAERAGVYPSGMKRHMTAALGTIETSLLDLTQAYAAIANGGAVRAPVSIHEMAIEGQQVISNGIQIGQGRAGSGLLASRMAIEDIMSVMYGVIQRGTASQAFRNHPVTIAGKTGTTQGYRDAWFVGVTPNIAIGVWIGRDDNQPMDGQASGGRNAAPVAARILREAHSKGMIDADGYTDELRSASITWPPLLGQGASGGSGFQIYSSAPDPNTPQSTTPPVSPPAAPGATYDPFWGVIQAPVPPANRDFRPVNRNEDLRRNRW